MSPRHMILPAGIVSSGWPAVRDVCASIGLHFDPWQQELNRAILAKDVTGAYAADTVVLSICRQAGKSYDIGALVFADAIIHPGTTSVWTAHRFKVARETFNEMRTWARRPELAPHIDFEAITTAAGNEVIPFRNGSRILFAARERGAIRGFTKVRRLVIDEAQILTESAMSDLAPTMNQATNPQLVLMGTPPKPADPGEVFTALRRDALEGRSDRVLYAEYAANPDADLDDWDAVADANPSFPHRTPKRAIERLRSLLTNDDDYRREGLGIWGAVQTAQQIIPAELWAACRHLDPDRAPARAYAVDASPDLRSAAIAASDGTTIMVLEHHPDVAWLPARLAELVTAQPAEVWLDPRGPAGALLGELSGTGVSWQEIKPGEHAQACGALLGAVIGGTLRHAGQPVLDEAVAGASRRTYGDAWAWNRRSTSVDISPLVAVTIARWAALQVDDGGPILW